MTVVNAIKHYLTSDDLVSALALRARNNGANVGLWRGLTLYRFTEPTAPQWEEIQSLSLGIIAQGSKAVIVDGKQYVYDQFNYLALSSNLHFQAQILEASPRKPFLSFVLEIDPALVRKISSEMLESRAAHLSVASRGDNYHKCVVSALDQDLLSSVLRFLQSLSAGTDRRVLAPLYMQEMVYRVLQREQFARMLHIAAQQADDNSIAAAQKYISEHLAEPLTVNAIAEQVSLSPSAFSHLFREVTGRSPYKFVKEMRLDRARKLLVEERLCVTNVSHAVGYASVSHFIKEFRTRFGTTPRDYADAHSLSEQLRARRQVVSGSFKRGPNPRVR